MKIKQICLLGALGLLSLTLYANTAPQECTWTNTYHADGQETPESVTTRQISTGRDGTTTYESCDQAIDRAKREAQRSFASGQYNEPITGDTARTCSSNYTPRPCSYTPPKTLDNPEPQPRSITIQQTGTDSDGNPCYESCADAQKRARGAFLDDEWGGHETDLKKAIGEYNEQVDEEADSATKKAEKTAKNQKLGGMVAMGGAALAAKRAMPDCPPKSGTGVGTCPWWAVAAALGVAGFKMYTASDENEEISREYSADLAGGGGNTGSTGTTGSTGATSSTSTTSSTGSTDSGPTDGPNLNGPGSTAGIPDPTAPTIDMPDGTTLTPTPDTMEDIVAGGGGNWDPTTGTITLPNGKKYSASDVDKPGFKKDMNMPAMSQFKKDMAGLKNQITSAMGAEDLLGGDGVDGDGSDSDNHMAGGGGGFSGYAGARRGGGGGYGADGGGRGLSGASSTGKKDGKSDIAGMSVKMGKDRVGVSQDNIFHMIHRRYQQKRKKQHFIEVPRG